MVTYKLIGNDYRYDYYCTDGGDIFYNDDSGKTQYPIFGIASREVEERHHGKLTKYVSVPLLHKDGGRTPAADAGEMIARSVFGVPMGVPGFVRLKDRHLHNIGTENMEFVQTGRYTGNIIAVWDKDGRTAVDSEDSEDSDKQVYWDELPGAQELIEYADKVRESRKKLNLGDRDRSVVAELLYTLITEKEMSAADALKTLAIPGGYDTLELFLEGKDIVGERVVNDIERAFREDQERDKKLDEVTAQINATCNWKIVDTSNKPAINKNGKHYRI